MNQHNFAWDSWLKSVRFLRRLDLLNGGQLLTMLAPSFVSSFLLKGNLKLQWRTCAVNSNFRIVINSRQSTFTNLLLAHVPRLPCPILDTLQTYIYVIYMFSKITIISLPTFNCTHPLRSSQRSSRTVHAQFTFGEGVGWLLGGYTLW